MDLGGFNIKFNSSLVIAIIIGLAFIYFAFKSFMPDMSSDYPDVEEMDQIPSFVPKGRDMDDVPVLPYRQD